MLKRYIAVAFAVFLVSGCLESDETIAAATTAATAQEDTVAKLARYTMDDEAKEAVGAFVLHFLRNDNRGFAKMVSGPLDPSSESFIDTVKASTAFAIRVKGSPSYTHADDDPNLFATFTDEAKDDTVLLARISPEAFSAPPVDGVEVDLACVRRNFYNLVVLFDGCQTWEDFESQTSKALTEKIARQIDRGSVNPVFMEIAAKGIYASKQGPNMRACFLQQSFLEGINKTFMCAAHSSWTNSDLIKRELQANNIHAIEHADGKVPTRLVNHMEASLPNLSMNQREMVVMAAYIMNDSIREIQNDEKNRSFSTYLGIDAVVSADQMWKDYDANEVAADAKYHGKKVVVGGKIVSINSGINRTPFVVLGSKNRYSSPSASFRNPDIEKISALKKGKELELVCEGGGEIMGTPMLKNCEFRDEGLAQLAWNKAVELERKIASDPWAINRSNAMVYALAKMQAKVGAHIDACGDTKGIVSCSTNFEKLSKDQSRDFLQHAIRLITAGVGSRGTEIEFIPDL